MKYPDLVRVDEFGNPLGPIDFYTAHAKSGQTAGVRHLSANVIVLDESRKRLLITRRSKIIESSGLLSSVVGGHVDWLDDKCQAEDPEIAAYRELQEEIFHDNLLPKEIYLERLGSLKKEVRPTDPEYTHLFQTCYNGPFYPNPEEVLDLFFQDFNTTLNNIQENPKEYTKSSLFFLQEFIKATT